MPLRFIDTGFYKHPFIAGLKGPYKALYIFILCDCDNAGMWGPDFQIASIYIDQKLDRETARKNFAGKFIELKNGKWFFPDFIQWQYPKGLSAKNPAHTKIIFELQKLDLIDENLLLKGTPQSPPGVPPSPSEGTKGKGKDIDKGKDEGMGKEETHEAELIHPLQKFIKESLPTVSKLRDQLTYVQCHELLGMYPRDKIKETLEAMENHQPLLKRYKSVNLTIHNWIKKRLNESGQASPTGYTKRPKGFHTDQELHEAALRVVGGK